MKLVLVIALRNFLRQRRRNILLGSAIAFGIMILTLANAFSKGITENLLNEIVIYVAGHIKVQAVEQGRYMTPIIRDREHVLKVVSQNITGISYTSEEVAGFCRAVGNGKGDYVYIVGIKPSQGFYNQFNLIKGNYRNFENQDIVNPLIVTQQKAKSLNVKIGDQVRIRFENVNGQNQTGILTLVGIVKGQNMFMDMAIFTPLKDLKKLMGYQEHETGGLKIILQEPKTAIEKADLIHKALKPQPALIPASLNNKDIPIILLPLDKEASANILTKIWSEATTADVKTEGAIISQHFASLYNLSPGDSLNFNYQERYAASVLHELEIKKIVSFRPGIPDNTIFVGYNAFFDIYNHHLPASFSKSVYDIALMQEDPAIWQVIATEYRLLPRTKTTDAYNKKIKEVIKDKRHQGTMDISSMYETASQIVKMEQVFNGVTLVASCILFFIIMIGILNSLRMTVRERTREIGTMRAIGMRRKDIRRVFIMETILLAIFSWLVGLLTGLLIMKLLALYQFAPDNALNMLMKDRSLFFVPTIGSALMNLILILFFAIGTSFFPANKAAKLRPVEAFRHQT